MSALAKDAKMRPNQVVCLERHANVGMLHQAEIDLIVEVVEETLERLGVKNAVGTCILDGQKFGEEAECIVRFNLVNGYGFRKFFREHRHTCTELAEEAIDAMLGWPEDSRYDESRLLMQSDDVVVRPEDLPSGVYCSGDLRVLLVNATHGRFLFSLYMGGIEQDECEVDEAVMYAVASMLGQLRSCDRELQQAAVRVCRALDRKVISTNGPNRKAMETVLGMVWPTQNAVAKAWHEWQMKCTAENRPLREFFLD